MNLSEKSRYDTSLKKYLHGGKIQKETRIVMQRVLKCHIIFALLLYGEILFAQSSILISNYNKSEYKAGNQNWDLSLDDMGNVFVANNSGFLTFNGANWNLKQLPGNTIIRSVAYADNKVYTGSFEEFGYWQHNSLGEWEYQSLIPLLKDYTLHNDEIWKIVKHNNKIYFQSFGAIFLYDYNSIKPLKIPGLVLFLLEADGHLYVQQINGGLFEINDTEIIPVPGSEIFRNTEIKAIIPLNGNELLIGTSSEGLFRYNGKVFSEWENDVSDELKEYKINNGISLNNKLVFGTILNGIYFLNKDGKLISHLSTDSSLQNNTILALESDRDGNLWVGMDKGIDYITLNSPIEMYKETWTSYSACIFQNNLYVATNQGIYYYTINKDGKFLKMKFLQGSQGQVWFIKEIDGELYCGLNNGTYKIDNFRLKQISNISGGYNLSKSVYQESELLVQSTYSSVVIYSKKGGTWVMDHTLEGFMAPARYLETDFMGNLWLGHSIQGLYLIQPSRDLDSVVKVKKIGKEEGLPENTNKVFKVDNRIVIQSGNLFYRWDDISGKMEPFIELNNQLEGFESATSVVSLPDSRYWFIKRNEWALFEIRFGKAKLLYRLIPEMYELNMVENYENIISLNDSLNLICLDNGFAILNIYNLNRLPEINKPPILRDIFFRKNSSRYIRINPASQPKAQIGNSHNNLSVSFTSNEPVGKRKYYQYELEGIDENWSDWTVKSEVNYTRLPSGNYTFKVRTLNSKGIITQPERFVFRIRSPWYLSIFAYFFYSAAIILSLIVLRMYFHKRLLRHKEILLAREREKIQQQKELAEQEIIKLSNEKLQAEVSHKNSQLANSTISIIKKNEVLIEINNEFESLKEELGYRMPNKYYERLKRLINQNIENEHDWEMFEKLFDQAHTNFFKRLKTEYPALTPSDLRLCAYLRMNLSSKEIAPLINITIRGVEERRYRLRKRLNLPAELNLTDYILSY